MKHINEINHIDWLWPEMIDDIGNQLLAVFPDNPARTAVSIEHYLQHEGLAGTPMDIFTMAEMLTSGNASKDVLPNVTLKSVEPVDPLDAIIEKCIGLTQRDMSRLLSECGFDIRGSWIERCDAHHPFYGEQDTVVVCKGVVHG